MIWGIITENQLYILIRGAYSHKAYKKHQCLKLGALSIGAEIRDLSFGPYSLKVETPLASTPQVGLLVVLSKWDFLPLTQVFNTFDSNKTNNWK